MKKFKAIMLIFMALVCLVSCAEYVPAVNNDLVSAGLVGNTQMLYVIATNPSSIDDLKTNYPYAFAGGKLVVSESKDATATKSYTFTDVKFTDNVMDPNSVNWTFAATYDLTSEELSFKSFSVDGNDITSEIESAGKKTSDLVEALAKTGETFMGLNFNLMAITDASGTLVINGHEVSAEYTTKATPEGAESVLFGGITYKIYSCLKLDIDGSAVSYKLGYAIPGSATEWDFTAESKTFLFSGESQSISLSDLLILIYAIFDVDFETITDTDTGEVCINSITIRDNSIDINDLDIKWSYGKDTTKHSYELKSDIEFTIDGTIKAYYNQTSGMKDYSYFPSIAFNTISYDAKITDKAKVVITDNGTEVINISEESVVEGAKTAKISDFIALTDKPCTTLSYLKSAFGLSTLEANLSIKESKYDTHDIFNALMLLGDN